MSAASSSGGGAPDGPADGRPRGPGGPPLMFAVLAFGGILLGGVIILGSVLAENGTGNGTPPAGPSPTVAAPGEAADRTREILVDALGAARFQVTDPNTPYRPGEPPVLMNAPRRVIQAILPGEPARGRIVIYELETEAEARSVGREFAQYLASGPGAVQYPNDAQFVLRRVGTTLVFFPWSPALAADERTAEIARVLETVGEEIAAG
jgi:hypothetical protein